MIDEKKLIEFIDNLKALTVHGGDCVFVAPSSILEFIEKMPKVGNGYHAVNDYRKNRMSISSQSMEQRKQQL